MPVADLPTGASRIAACVKPLIGTAGVSRANHGFQGFYRIFKDVIMPRNRPGGVQTGLI